MELARHVIQTTQKNILCDLDGSIWSHLRTKNKWTEGGALRPLISFSKCRSLGVFRSHLGAIWEPLRGKFGHLRTKWSQVVPNSYLHLDYSTWWWCLGSNNGLAACDSLWLLLGLYILYILKYIVYICTINMYAISIIVHTHMSSINALASSDNHSEPDRINGISSKKSTLDGPDAVSTEPDSDDDVV